LEVEGMPYEDLQNFEQEQVKKYGVKLQSIKDSVDAIVAGDRGFSDALARFSKTDFNSQTFELQTGEVNNFLMTRKTDLDRALGDLSEKRETQRKGVNRYVAVMIGQDELTDQLKSAEDVYISYDRTLALLMELFLYLDKYREKSMKELQSGYMNGWQKVVPQQITAEAEELNKRFAQLAKNLGAEVEK
jgi:vacuolar-type H+-ATPase catalytic subunit A/Vma1